MNNGLKKKVLKFPVGHRGRLKRRQILFPEKNVRICLRSFPPTGVRLAMKNIKKHFFLFPVQYHTLELMNK